MNNNPLESDVTVGLSKAEALVLFELLSRFSETGKLTIEHKTESQVLWNVCCSLEKILLEPFTENYAEALKTARESLNLNE